MSASKKDRLFSAALVGVILALGVWIGMSRFPDHPAVVKSKEIALRIAAKVGYSPGSSTDLVEPLIPTKRKKPERVEPTSGTLVAASLTPRPGFQKASPEELYSEFGKLHIFAPLATPTPRPTPPPAPTPRPPRLYVAVQNWVFEYPFKGKFVFSDKRTKEEFTLTPGEPFSLKDGTIEFDVNVTENGKYGVTVTYPGPPEQKKSFSLLE